MSALSEQPPPRKGAKAGYYPDPLGSGRSRWWDGANWTHTVGPPVAADMPRSKRVPPPTKVCRHCGAQAETFEGNCPHCGRAYGQSRGAIIGIIAAACGVGLLFLGGCAALIVVGVNEAEEELEETAITRAQFNSIEIGATRPSVEARLGGAWDRETFHERSGPVTCLYYPERDKSIFSEHFELCFVNGRLDSKHAP